MTRPHRYGPTLRVAAVLTPVPPTQGRGLSADVQMTGSFRPGGWEERAIAGGLGTGGLECNPPVLPDDVVMRSGGRQSREYAPFNEIVNPEQVEAVEVYRRCVEVPGRFGGEWAMCGVIANWIR